MQSVWLQILLVMIGGMFVKYFFVNALVWVIIDLAVFGIAYYIINKHPFIDAKSSLIFLGGLTVINILVDFSIITGMVANLLILGMLAWVFFGRGRGSR